MSLRSHILAILVGASVPWLAVSLIGYWAAQPTPGPNWIELYSLVVSALPTLMVSAAGALLLAALGVREGKSYALSYAAAIASFLLLVKPWFYGAGHTAGVAAHWEQYLYLLVLPVLGAVLINNSLKSGAPKIGAP